MWSGSRKKLDQLAYLTLDIYVYIKGKVERYKMLFNRLLTKLPPLSNYKLLR